MELFICIEMNLALNNLQWLICHKTKQNQTNFQTNLFDNTQLHDFKYLHQILMIFKQIYLIIHSYMVSSDYSHLIIIISVLTVI